MKKFLLTILTCIYMLTSGGMMVSVHYCMGKMVSAGFLHDDEDGVCGKCHMNLNTEQAKKCCKEEKKLIKSQYDQATHQAKMLVSQSVVLLPSSPVFYASFLEETPVSLFEFSQYNRPPPKSKLRSHVLLNVFLV